MGWKRERTRESPLQGRAAPGSESDSSEAKQDNDEKQTLMLHLDYVAPDKITVDDEILVTRGRSITKRTIWTGTLDRKKAGKYEFLSYACFRSYPAPPEAMSRADRLKHLVASYPEDFKAANDKYKRLCECAKIQPKSFLTDETLLPEGFISVCTHHLVLIDLLLTCHLLSLEKFH